MSAHCALLYLCTTVCAHWNVCATTFSAYFWIPFWSRVGAQTGHCDIHLLKKCTLFSGVLLFVIALCAYPALSVMKALVYLDISVFITVDTQMRWNESYLSFNSHFNAASFSVCYFVYLLTLVCYNLLLLSCASVNTRTAVQTGRVQ